MEYSNQTNVDLMLDSVEKGIFLIKKILTRLDPNDSKTNTIKDILTNNLYDIDKHSKQLKIMVKNYECDIEKCWDKNNLQEKLKEVQTESDKKYSQTSTFISNQWFIDNDGILRKYK